MSLETPLQKREAVFIPPADFDLQAGIYVFWVVKFSRAFQELLLLIKVVANKKLITTQNNSTAIKKMFDDCAIRVNSLKHES